MDGMDIAQRNRRFFKRAVLWCACMFLFGFAMVPIYRIACVHVFKNRIYNTADSGAKVAGFAVDNARWVTVQFIGNVNSQLDWQFAPEKVSVKVHPGALSEAWFDATNHATSAIVGNAVPSIAPSKASPYFNKTECFCFTEQVLKSGELRRMPVKFIVDPKLPADIDTLTLSYTFYNNQAATKKLAEQTPVSTQPAS
jgi:cytochrome c oxidase assembly protein subunit 11